jgi:hypothetical protein
VCIRTAMSPTDDRAREELWPDYKIMRDRIGAERGWPPMTREHFDAEIEHGSLYVGAPETSRPGLPRQPKRSASRVFT